MVRRRLDRQSDQGLLHQVPYGRERVRPRGACVRGERGVCVRGEGGRDPDHDPDHRTGAGDDRGRAERLKRTVAGPGRQQITSLRFCAAPWGFGRQSVSVAVWEEEAAAHEGRLDRWLNGEDPQELQELLRPYPADRMTMWPVSMRANSPKNDDPDLLARVDEDDLGRGRGSALERANEGAPARKPT